MHKIGIDLGGTKTEGILLDGSLKTIERKRLPTPKDNYQEIINTIHYLINDISGEITDFTVGVCTPGAISKKTGLLKNSNTQCLIGKPLKEDLENKLDKKISIENDANCFAISEATMGAGKNHSFVFGVILGTGVGGGIVIDGKIHRGRTNIAGEWGHQTLHQNGNSCYCGKKGCVEAYISGPALELQWKEITGKTQPLVEIVKATDDSNFILWKNTFLDNLGTSLANVIDVLDPDVIVLGGGLSNIEFLYSDGIKNVYEKVFSDLVDTPILKNSLGDSAGVFGAALLNF
ncbi:MAG: ROK family protein [Nitrosopumilaceae archaeon]